MTDDQRIAGVSMLLGVLCLIVGAYFVLGLGWAFIVAGVCLVLMGWPAALLANERERRRKAEQLISEKQGRRAEP